MQDASTGPRPPRLAMLQLRGLEHFLPDLAAGLAATGALEVRRFTMTGPEVLAEAMHWAGDPARDALWFEFCWPPFPDLIARTEFGGRRVIAASIGSKPTRRRMPRAAPGRRWTTSSPSPRTWPGSCCRRRRCWSGRRACMWCRTGWISPASPRPPRRPTRSASAGAAA